MIDQPKPPLWRVMDASYSSYPLTDKWECSAAWASEIRALANWLVPEESSETFLPGEDSHGRSQRQQRRHLRWTLLAEAKRAEACE